MRFYFNFFLQPGGGRSNRVKSQFPKSSKNYSAINKCLFLGSLCFEFPDLCLILSDPKILRQKYFLEFFFSTWTSQMAFQCQAENDPNPRTLINIDLCGLAAAAAGSK